MQRYSQALASALVASRSSRSRGASASSRVPRRPDEVPVDGGRPFPSLHRHQPSPDRLGGAKRGWVRPEGSIEKKTGEGKEVHPVDGPGVFPGAFGPRGFLLCAERVGHHPLRSPQARRACVRQGRTHHILDKGGAFPDDEGGRPMRAPRACRWPVRRAVCCER